VVAIAEPISPELVLVSGDLRTLAIAELLDPTPELEGPDELASETNAPMVTGQTSLVARVVLYAAWNLLIGAFFSLGAIAAVALVLLALSLAA
jgi:hypothetical protein